VKYILVPVLILAIVGLVYLYKPATNTGNKPETSADLILFWGDGCPHCEVVRKWLSDNNLSKSSLVDQREVYYNRTNQELLQQKASLCTEITDKSQIGVPLGFVVKTGKCLQGSEPIINWLSSTLLK